MFIRSHWGSFFGVEVLEPGVTSPGVSGPVGLDFIRSVFNLSISNPVLFY